MRKLKLIVLILLSQFINCINLNESSPNDLIFIAANLPATASCSKSGSTQCLNVSVKSYEIEYYCKNNGYTSIKTKCSDMSAGKCTYTYLGYNIVSFYGSDFTTDTARTDCESISGGIYTSQ